MVLLIVLFLTNGMLVSSNNGYPTIPAQTYPSYQQNGYANPSVNQLSEITPYLQSMMVQNQLPSMNLSPSDVRQMLLNRILSDQPLPTILDQNLSGYGSNLVECPHNNMIAPNAVNNYFAAPLINEYANNQPNGVNMQNKAMDINTKDKPKKAKKRKSKTRRKHENTENNIDTSRKNDEANGVQVNDQETSKKTRKRYRKPKTETTSHNNHTISNENETDKKTKKKKHKSKENEKSPVEEETKVEKSQTRRRRKKKPKSDKSADKVVSEQLILTKPTQIQEGINLAQFAEGITEENRIPRNPIPEGNDLFKSIPNLPENIANSFNFKGLPQFNNPAMSNFFANYENVYQSMLAKNKGTKENKEVIVRKPRRKINNRRKTEVKKKNSTITAATAPANLKPITSPKVNIVTTEKTIYIEEKTLTNINPTTEKESLESVTERSESNEPLINEYDIKRQEVEEIESNINDSNMNYGYIDDYYPQFADSAAYTANNKEVFVKNLGDTKYYYTVDKRNPDFINRMRFEGFGLPERITKDYEVNKKYDNTEREGMKSASKPDSKDINEKVEQFRSPPHLEIPDFQTRKVERYEINPDSYYLFDGNEDVDSRFLGDKASIYSEAKIPNYVGAKDDYKKLKDKHKDVETVFARSKVVSYGPVYNPEDDYSSADIGNQAFTDSSYFEDGGTAFVLAKSLDTPDMSW